MKTKIRGNEQNYFPMSMNTNTHYYNDPYSSSYIENRLNQCTNDFDSSLKSIDLKFITLKDHINKMREYIEISAIKRDNEKTEIIEDIKRIKSQLKLSIAKDKAEISEVIDKEDSMLQSQLKLIADETNQSKREIKELLNDLSTDTNNQLNKMKEKETSNRQMIGSSLLDIKNDYNAKVKCYNMTIDSNKEEANRDYSHKLSRIKEIDSIAAKNIMKEKRNEELFENTIKKLIPNLNKCFD